MNGTRIMKISPLFLLIATATSFSASPPVAVQRRFVTAVADTQDTFYEAVKCAEKTGKVNIDKCDRLATELEQFQGASFEEGELGEKEIQDRLDVAEILRLKIELQLR